MLKVLHDIIYRANYFFKKNLGDGIDDWNREKWQQELSKHQVLVMIHDALKLALNHGGFHLEMVNLLIVDECHHSFGNSSFNQIFEHHYHPLKERFPGNIHLFCTEKYIFLRLR